MRTAQESTLAEYQQGHEQETAIQSHSVKFVDEHEGMKLNKQISSPSVKFGCFPAWSPEGSFFNQPG